MKLVSTLKFWFYNHFKHIKITGGVNCRLRHVRISSCGIGNKILLGNNVTLVNVEIKIFGNNNCIKIHDNNTISHIRFAIEDDKNVIEIGNHVYIGTGTLLAALEGHNISIGKDCMIAGPCEMRTSDSHSLTDMNGNRINPANDITIGEHVWIGAGCMLLKGCSIPANSVIAARSVVTSTMEFESNSLWGGTPARCIKKGINWNRTRI